MESDHERCTICKRALKGGEELMKHIQEDHNRTKCPKCEKMIAANLMDRHSEEHITRERISKGKKVKKSSQIRRWSRGGDLLLRKERVREEMRLYC